MKMRLPRAVEAAMRRLEENGFSCYLVGGCVRDFLMGKRPNDYDLTTAATPEQTKSCFDDARVIETGMKHGTVTVIIEGESIEITTFRIDGDYADNRRPTSVSFTPNLHEDLARRDFTVNAMAYNSDGVSDPFGGMEDLRRRVIRCVGDPAKRFDEDGLRILRAMRFSATLGFQIDPACAVAIHDKAALLENISFERKRDELKKLICGVDAERVLNEFWDVAVLLLPEVGEHSAAVRERLSRLSGLPLNAGLRAAFLLSPLSADEVGRVLTRFKLDNKTRRLITSAVAEQKAPLDTKAGAHRLIHRVGFDAARWVAYIRQDTNALEVIDLAESSGTPVTLAQLAVNGEDLNALGVQKGRAVGEMLEHLLLAVIDGEAPNDRDSLLDFAEKILKGTES